MIIRRLGSDEAVIFKELRRDAVQGAPQSFYPTVVEISNAPSKSFARNAAIRVWLRFRRVRRQQADVDHRTAARARAKLRHKANIWGAYTRAEYWGKGIARRMMETALETVRSIPDITLITLGVHSKNTAAKSLYASFGFETFGVARNSMCVNGSYVDEGHMMLRQTLPQLDRHATPT